MFKAKDKNFKVDVRDILFHLPGHVYWKDKNGVILGCNDEQCKHAGVENSNAVVGKTIFDLLKNKEEAIKIAETDNFVIQTGLVKIVEEYADSSAQSR